MAYGIEPSVAVGLIEHVHLPVLHQCAWGAQPFGFAVLCRVGGYHANAVPVYQVVAFGDAYSPPFSTVPAVWRQREVHQIAAVELYHVRVFAVRFSHLQGVGKHHLPVCWSFSRS